MADPVTQKTWTIGANNQIVFVSLNVTQGTYLKGIADFLLAHGYTCKGSCDGVTGTMDGTNRWTTAALASVRGANTGAANSWMVLTDGNGCNLCLSYVGATDDIARFSFSGSGAFVLAGTATFTPTATDEVVINSITTIGATASVDRWWFGWVDSTSKLCRFVIMRSGAMVGVAWGLELARSRVGIAWSPTVVGWSQTAANFLYQTGTGFLDFATIGGAFFGAAQTGLRGGGLQWGVAVGQAFQGVITENQGSVGYGMTGPVSFGYQSLGTKRGVVCQLYDLWGGLRNGGVAGDTWNTKAFAAFSGGNPMLFPWDGATVPNVGGGAPATQTGQGFGFENAGTEAYGSWMTNTSVYVPLANNAVTPVGPTAAKTIARRPGVDLVRINDRTDDPPAEAGKTLIYSRTISGEQALFARYPDGTVLTLAVGS